MERYFQRIDRHTSLSQARKRLEAAAAIAQRRGQVKQKTGETHWTVREDPRLVLVTRRVGGETRIVTVLGPEEPTDEQSAIQVDESMRQWTQDVLQRVKDHKEKRRDAEKRYEKAYEENVRLRKGLRIAIGALQQLECLPEAASAMVALQDVVEDVNRGE